MEPFLRSSCCGRHRDILIVGEGNFSFAVELSKHVGNHQQKRFHVNATSFDPQEVVYKNDFARKNIVSLRAQSHVTVRHGVDATRLHESFSEQLIFSKIIFNFPHVGGKSNIKKCRLLLEQFFCSAGKFLCKEGDVIVSLCTGQGGTPADISRGAYGNTWKVVSQAAKAGLYLGEIEPFQFDLLETYKQAGYRGNIGQGFLTKGGLIHTFRKGDEFRADQMNEWKSRINTLDSLLVINEEILADQTTFECIRNQRQRVSPISDILEEKLSIPMTEYFFRNMSSSFSYNDPEYYTSEMIIPDKFLFHANRIGFNYIDMMSLISPMTPFISRHAVFLIPSNQLNDDIKIVRDEIMNILEIESFKNFQCKKTSCQCKSLSCLCHYGDNRLRPYLLEYSPNDVDYDVEKVPYFIDDVPQSLWATFEPECTISRETTEKQIVYDVIQSSAYTLGKSEEKFFSIKKTNQQIQDTTYNQKLTIDGICVVTSQLLNNNKEKNEDMLAVTFHVTNILFSCYNVTDLRCLTIEDKRFSSEILDILRFDSEHNDIQKHSMKYQSVVKYPLCHRHDLCFWLDEKYSEQNLFAAVRLICGNLLHSVRLIKVLRHTETNLVSYCYRMIYCRLDGPFHHEECVIIQNELRRYLLELGFQLR